MEVSGNSPAIVSSQIEPHPRLDEVVRLHGRGGFARPIPDHATATLVTLTRFLAGSAASEWWLDAGCGTGESTLALAQLAGPRRAVVGVDKSLARLDRGPLARGELPANVLLLRADLVDLWRLLLDAGCRPARQFMLFPNPWPKPDQLRRRWHGHPVWPVLWALCPSIEMRTNWFVYAREFARAASLSDGRARIERYAPAVALSPHERKYARSGHVLWRVVTQH